MLNKAVKLNYRDYIAIARPDHWFKNIFVIPGVVFAEIITQKSEFQLLAPLLLGFISICSIASANYVINEWLDAETDRFHPTKKNRPAAAGKLNPFLVYLEYAILVAIGLLLANLISPYFLATSVLFMIMGIIYNVPPFRTKERVYLDVLSESVNNPIRLMLGWFMVTSYPLPPSSLLLGYWMGGAFLMAIKRYGEFRFIGDAKIAGLYRRSFRYYSEKKLLVSSFFYSLCAAFFLGVFLVKYRIEFLLLLPFLAFLFSWYLYIGMKANSPVQNPEKLLRQKFLFAYLVGLMLLSTILLIVDIPWLHWFLENSFITQNLR